MYTLYNCCFSQTFTFPQIDTSKHLWHGLQHNHLHSLGAGSGESSAPPSSTSVHQSSVDSLYFNSWETSAMTVTVPTAHIKTASVFGCGEWNKRKQPFTVSNALGHKHPDSFGEQASRTKYYGCASCNPKRWVRWLWGHHQPNFEPIK